MYCNFKFSATRNIDDLMTSSIISYIFLSLKNSLSILKLNRFFVSFSMRSAAAILTCCFHLLSLGFHVSLKKIFNLNVQCFLLSARTLTPFYISPDLLHTCSHINQRSSSFYQFIFSLLVLLGYGKRPWFCKAMATFFRFHVHLNLNI